MRASRDSKLFGWLFKWYPIESKYATLCIDEFNSNDCLIDIVVWWKQNYIRNIKSSLWKILFLLNVQENQFTLKWVNNVFWAFILNSISSWNSLSETIYYMYQIGKCFTMLMEISNNISIHNIEMIHIFIKLNFHHQIIKIIYFNRLRWH